ncbi:lysophospholipid acyltransferase family protein [Botryobacter ruber]|uniref:lysophospholipid acyltransferase family protein n=1 Tax=Botryobacter ruber TaxID=2171629 RepID=UPI000E0B7D1A|nr:lysophospholipid acyltransferase family protein [Botryobacter ruber]
MQQKVRDIYNGIMAMTLMSLSGTLALLLRLLSFGLLTDFCRSVVIANSSRLILRLLGIKLILPPPSAFPKEQVLYTFNHNYYLDVLIITALGLQNTRFFLSEKTRKIIPLTISALAIGTLYIPMKKSRRRRRRFFQAAAGRVRTEGCSVFASSEGVHEFVHGIAPFNKGIYHLALTCGLPVVPVYFHVPEEINPLEQFSFRKGTVRVEVLEPIDTRNWEVLQLRQHVNEVRQRFIKKYNDAHGIRQKEVAS